MTHDRATRVTYRGNPAFASMLAQMLEEEGVEVTWERPEEQRGLGEMAQGVIVEMVASGGVLAITAAVNRFRAHIHGKAETSVEVEDEDEDEDEDEVEDEDEDEDEVEDDSDDPTPEP